MKDGKKAALLGQRTNPTHCPKLRYETRKRALGAAAAQSKWSGEELQAYKCHDCKAWHIGHSLSRRQRGIA